MVWICHDSCCRLSRLVCCWSFCCLICRVFIEAVTILFCLYPEFCTIWLRVFSKWFLGSSFFHKSLLVHVANLMFFNNQKKKKKKKKNAVEGHFRRSPNHIRQHLRSVWQSFSFGKLTNHYWNVNSNPVLATPKQMSFLTISIPKMFLNLKALDWQRLE